MYWFIRGVKGHHSNWHKWLVGTQMKAWMIGTEGTHTLLSQDTRMKQIFSVNHSFSTIWACASKSDIFSIKGAGQVLTSDNYENFASTKTLLWKKKRICDFLALAMKFIMTFQQHFSRKITSHHTCTSTQPGSSRTKGATLSPTSSKKVYWCLFFVRRVQCMKMIVKLYQGIISRFYHLHCYCTNLNQFSNQRKNVPGILSQKLITNLDN